MSFTQLPDRIASKIEVANDGCWLWTGARSSNGYGVSWHNLRAISAHRFAYELLVGPIPEGLTLDHLCRVRHCVNPAHLEPVTMRENLLRGEGWTALNARKTHCPRGHSYDDENTYISGGKRYCLTCRASRRSSPEYRTRQRLYERIWRERKQKEARQV